MSASIMHVVERFFVFNDLVHTIKAVPHFVSGFVHDITSRPF